MARKHKSTIIQVSDAVKEAAQKVMEKTDEYVVQPVGRALGLKAKPRSRKARAGSVRKTNPARRTAGSGKTARARASKRQGARG